MIMLVVAAVSAVAAADPVYVYVDVSNTGYEDGSADDPWNTIAEGIEHASSGYVIRVVPGTYYEHDLDINGIHIEITSWDPQTGDPDTEGTLIDAHENGRVLWARNMLPSPIIITGFTIQNGVDDLGGGVAIASANVQMNACRIQGCSAISSTYGGGGIYIDSSSVVTLSGCTVSGNSAWDGGGIYVVNSSLRLQDDCTIGGNMACYGAGGGIYCTGSTLAMVDCDVTHNGYVEFSHFTGIGGGIAADLRS